MPGRHTSWPYPTERRRRINGKRSRTRLPDPPAFILVMCGICGSTQDPTGAAVRRMNARLVHRGPDDEGVYCDPSAAIALGARRLSIIDVAGGHQPVSNEDSTVWAALNGEIYNHRKLQEHLIKHGHRFRSRTDTEVLVHLYEEYGDSLVHALDGMYAFAIWDTKERRLLLARDRFGEKPLFYHQRDGVLTFASELTALLHGAPIPRELNLGAVDAYFVFGYVPGPASIVSDVWQLPPAHTLTWQAGRPPAIQRYWQPSDTAVATGESPRELADEAARLLRSSVKSRMIADVPLGVLLSGGIDSSLIAVLAAEASHERIKTFTVGYDVGDVTETGSARRTAQEIGSEQHELMLKEDEVSATATDILARLDQPLADQALIATHAITRFARTEVTVAVGGEGADELFGGYPRYRWLRRAAMLSRLPAAARAGAASLAGRLPADGRIKRLSLVLSPQQTIERHIDWVTDGRRQLREVLYVGDLKHAVIGKPFVPDAMAWHVDMSSFELDVPGSVMRLDQVHWLPDDVLAKADRASMLNSLELRTPFLNRDVSEFAASIPTGIHTASGGKRLLRMLGNDVGISAASRAKTAFRVPAPEWLRGSLATVVHEQVNRGSIYDRCLFDRDRVRRLVAEHDQGMDRTHVLWPLLALGLWADRLWGVDAG